MLRKLVYSKRSQRIVSVCMALLLIFGLSLGGLQSTALADDASLSNSDVNDRDSSDSDASEDSVEDTAVSPSVGNDYTAVIGPGADNLVIPLNTRSPRSKDDHGGDWVLGWDGYCPWIEIVDENGQQVSDAYVEVSWSGPFSINWYRSGEMVLDDGRLLIQQVEPVNWRAIESGDVTFNFTVKSQEDDEVLGTCSAGPVSIGWDWGPWIQIDSGLDDLTIPADTWSVGSWDSHNSKWATGADFRFYPSVRILDGNGFAIEEEITVSWNGDFLINGKPSGELRLAEGDLMMYSIKPQSGTLPDEPSEILLSFSFRGAGRDYRFDDVGPLCVNWVPTIVDEDDSQDSPYWVYIDGGEDKLDLTVPTQRWSTALNYDPGDWSQDSDGLYYPSIWVVDNDFAWFWADVTVYWDGPYRINWSQSGDLRLRSSQLMITNIMPQQGAVIEDEVSSLKLKFVVKPWGSEEVYTYSNIAVNVTWDKRFPLVVQAYEVHPDSPLDTHTICDLWLVEDVYGEEMLIYKEHKESNWTGRHNYYPWQGSWRASMSAPGYTPRYGGLAEAWSELIAVPPDVDTQSPPVVGLSFVGETGEPYPYVYWRDDDDETYTRSQGRYQIDFNIPVKTDGVSERVSLWKDGEQVEAQIVPVRPMDDPDYGTIAVLFNIYPTDGYQESDFAALLQSFYTIRIDAGVEAYNGNATDKASESTVEAFSGGGGEELPKLGLGPSAEGEEQPEPETPGGTDNPDNPSNPNPNSPTPGTPPLGSQDTEWAPPYPASSTERDEISDTQTPLAPESSTTTDKPPADSYKGTQRSGPLPNPSDTQSNGLLLALSLVVLVGAGSGAGYYIHMRRGKVKRA